MKTFDAAAHRRRLDQLGSQIDVLRREIDAAKTTAQKRRRRPRVPLRRK